MDLAHRQSNTSSARAAGHQRRTDLQTYATNSRTRRDRPGRPRRSTAPRITQEQGKDRRPSQQCGLRSEGCPPSRRATVIEPLVQHARVEAQHAAGLGDPDPPSPQRSQTQHVRAPDTWPRVRRARAAHLKGLLRRHTSGCRFSASAKAFVAVVIILVAVVGVVIHPA